MQPIVEYPITELADIQVVRGYNEINRLNQKRSITVTADIDEKVANARETVAALHGGVYSQARNMLFICWEDVETEG